MDDTFEIGIAGQTPGGLDARSGPRLPAVRDLLASDAVLPWLVVALFAIRYVMVALAFPPLDGDLFWQRWLGDLVLHAHRIPTTLGSETFTAAGAPWTAQEWLFSALLAASDAHHLRWLFASAAAGAVVIAVVSVVLRCRRRGVSSVVTTGVVIVAGGALAASFGIRAQVAGWAFLALLLTALESEGPWPWAAIPITVAWANLHASALLAPAVAGLFALAVALRERSATPAVRRALLIVVGCAAATTMTPLGIALPRYALMLLASPIRSAISEWQPTSFAIEAFQDCAFPLVLALMIFGIRARDRSEWRDPLLVGAFTVLLFAAGRNIAVFAIAVAPIAAAAIPRPAQPPASTGAAAPRARADAVMVPLLTVASLIAGVALLVAVQTQARKIEPALPVPLVAQIEALPGEHRVLCQDFAWCSLFLGSPTVRVFIDGRCDPFPAAVWHDYFDVIKGTRRWSAILDAQRVDAVIVRSDAALDALLAGDRREWRLAGHTKQQRLYLRSTRARSAQRIGEVDDVDEQH